MEVEREIPNERKLRKKRKKKRRKRRKKMEVEKEILKDIVTVEREIPDDIVTEILARLQSKCLLQLKCECKLWRSTISGSYFINLQLEMAKRDPKIIISLCENDDRFNSLHFLIADKNGLPIHKWTNVVDNRVSSPYDFGINSYLVSSSCNGLLCFYGSEDIYVCNPSTRQMKLLPKPSSSSHPFFGSVPFFGCGFGFDPSTNKYKVVKLMKFPQGSNPQCEILTLGSGSWRSIDMDPYPLVNRRSVFVSGKIHWKTGFYKRPDNQILSFDRQILSFDVGNEEFAVVPPPDSFAANEWSLVKMAEVGGYLCLSKIELDDNGGLMNLWILKDYANHGWIKQSITFPFQQQPVPVAIQNEEVLVCICEGLPRRKFRSYNLQSKSWAGMAYLPEDCLSAQSYVDSLVPLQMKPDAWMQTRCVEMKPDDDKNDAEDPKGDQE